MGLNTASKKVSKTNQRIPKRELKQIQELKLENKDLKKQIKALHKFIKRIKAQTPARSILPYIPKEEPEKKEDRCPECDGKLKTLSLPRLDGVFKRIKCLECEWVTSFTVNE